MRMRATWVARLAAIPTSWALKGAAPPTDRFEPQTVMVQEEFYCPDYSSHAYRKHEPLSTGKYELSYQRPHPGCRKFNLSEVEDVIHTMSRDIRDPDLFRLFENCFPNTLDTAIAWKGTAKGHNDEEVCHISSVALTG